MSHLANMMMESDSTQMQNPSLSAKRELRELWNLWVQEHMTLTELMELPSPGLRILTWVPRQAEDR